MVTLVRWFMIKSKEIKYKLVFWQFIDQIFVELKKHPEQFEEKITDSIMKMILTNKNETEQ